jgi:hypothetical protein
MRRKAGQAAYLRLNERRLQQCFAKLHTRAPRVARVRRGK